MIVVLRMKKAIQLTNQNPTNARCITVHGLQFSTRLTGPTVATVYAKWIYGQADTGALSDRSRHVQKIWDHNAKNHMNAAENWKSDVTKIEQQIELLLEWILSAETALVIATYEKRIQSLEEQKLLLDEKLRVTTKSRAALKNLLEPLWIFLQALGSFGLLDDLRTKDWC